MVNEHGKVAMTITGDKHPQTGKPCVRMGMYLVSDKDDDNKGFTVLMSEREMASFILALVNISAEVWGMGVVEIVNEPKLGNFSPN